MALEHELPRLRKERGLTQRDLARKLGMAQTTVANYEGGLRFPDETRLMALADYFGVSLDILLGRREFPEFPDVPDPALRDWDGIRRRFLELVERDPPGARRYLYSLRRTGTALEDILLRVCEPLLYDTGRNWAEGTWGEAEEHIISRSIEEVIAALAVTAEPRKPGTGRVLGLPALGERHTIGLQMVMVLLAQEGWTPWYYGHELPAREVVRVIREKEIGLLLISAVMPRNREGGLALVRAVRAAYGSAFPIVLGGGAFSAEGFSGVEAPAAGSWREVLDLSRRYLRNRPEGRG